MNIIQTTKQRTTIPPLLLFSISLFLLCNSFMAAAVPYAIGDKGPGQGIVFFVSTDGEHGLEAAPSDQSTGIAWNNGSDTVTNAVRNGVNAGLYNTERIILNQGAGSYAAQLCANYRGGGYGDWYLPSKRELKLLYKIKDIVGGFTSNSYYWSSTDNDGVNAWGHDFLNGSQEIYGKYSTLWVRAVRAF